MEGRWISTDTNHILAELVQPLLLIPGPGGLGEDLVLDPGHGVVKDGEAEPEGGEQGEEAGVLVPQHQEQGRQQAGRHRRIPLLQG